MPSNYASQAPTGPEKLRRNARIMANAVTDDESPEMGYFPVMDMIGEKAEVHTTTQRAKNNVKWAPNPGVITWRGMSTRKAKIQQIEYAVATVSVDASFTGDKFNRKDGSWRPGDAISRALSDAMASWVFGQARHMMSPRGAWGKVGAVFNGNRLPVSTDGFSFANWIGAEGTEIEIRAASLNGARRGSAILTIESVDPDTQELVFASVPPAVASETVADDYIFPCGVIVGADGEISSANAGVNGTTVFNSSMATLRDLCDVAILDTVNGISAAADPQFRPHKVNIGGAPAYNTFDAYLMSFLSRRKRVKEIRLFCNPAFEYTVRLVATGSTVQNDQNRPFELAKPSGWKTMSTATLETGFTFRGPRGVKVTIVPWDYLPYGMILGGSVRSDAQGLRTETGVDPRQKIVTSPFTIFRPQGMEEIWFVPKEQGAAGKRWYRLERTTNQVMDAVCYRQLATAARGDLCMLDGATVEDPFNPSYS